MTDRKPIDKREDERRILQLRPRMALGLFDGLFGPFDRAFEPFAQLGEFALTGQQILDMQDRGDHYTVTAELPGFAKDEVEVKVDGHGLELRAQKTEKGGDEDGFRSSRSYYRYLTLPPEAVPQKIDGTMRNGILQLRIPKKDPKLKDAVRRIDLK